MILYQLFHEHSLQIKYVLGKVERKERKERSEGDWISHFLNQNIYFKVLSIAMLFKIGILQPAGVLYTCKNPRLTE